MKLYIARHGQAEARNTSDEERALTRLGRAELERLSLFLGTCGIEVVDVFHSGYRRAHESAEILARSLSATLRIDPLEGLTPDDSVEPVAALAETWTDDTLLVAHLPFVQRLVSLLVLGRPGEPCLTFLPGTVACLERVGKHWSLEWVVHPGLLGAPPGM